MPKNNIKMEQNKLGLRADLSCEFVDTIPKIDSSATGNE
jgi:hypothetical protein